MKEPTVAQDVCEVRIGRVVVEEHAAEFLDDVGHIIITRQCPQHLVSFCSNIVFHCLFHFEKPVVWIVSLADLDDSIYSWPVCVIWSWVRRPLLPCHAGFGLRAYIEGHVTGVLHDPGLLLFIGTQMSLFCFPCP